MGVAVFLGVAAFLAAVFFGAAFFTDGAGAGALRFLVIRPVLVLPKIFSGSVTAGAWWSCSVTVWRIQCDGQLTGGALRLLAVLAVGLAFAPAFFVVGAFFVAAALVAFLGAPTFFLGAASTTVASFFAAVFCPVMSIRV